MSRLFAFLILAAIKTVGRIFYRFDLDYIGQSNVQWSEVKLIAWLNHTSLFDIFLVSVLPYSFLWRASKHCITPIAAKTYHRPVVGFLFRHLTMRKSLVSQKRDDTWAAFLESIDSDTIVALFPEGRMKRKNGLDKNGKPLSVKGGIADVIAEMDTGLILFEYSGGMHHVQAPGQRIPKLFKTIRIRLETESIERFKERLHEGDHERFKTKVIDDLTARRDAVLSDIGT